MARVEITERVAYWLTPVGSDEKAPEEVIRTLVGEERLYAFRENAKGRLHLKPRDRICFYASGRGVIADAEVASPAEKKSYPRLTDLQWYPWVIHLDNVRLYLKEPTVIDNATRGLLEAFAGRKPDAPWAWFVQTTRRVSEHDFAILTRRSS
jgi:hypothetical protein